MAVPERRVVVIGAAHPHVQSLVRTAQAIEGMKVVGVYDEQPQRAREIGEAMGVAAVPRLESIFELRPHLSMIVSVPDQRADLAIQSVHAGVPALVDKPLALDEKALQRLRRAVEETGRRIITYYPTRGYPVVAAAYQAVRAGRIGRVVRVMASAPHWLRAPTRPAWHFERRTNGDIFLDLASHSLDVCCWLLDQSPSAITARFGNYANPLHPEFRDLGHCSMRFPNGELADVEVDWLIADSHQCGSDMRLWIQGTAGRIDISVGRTEQATICTREVTEPLAGAPISLGQWTSDLLISLCDGTPAVLAQDEIWRASELSLRASDAARAEEQERLA